jgi:hypothetical protein
MLFIIDQANSRHYVYNRLMERYSDLINTVVDLLDSDSKSFEEIVETFDAVITRVFEDGIYNCGRFLAVEEFAKVLASRTNYSLLLKTFKDRIDLEYSKWFNNASSFRHRGPTPYCHQ